MLMTYSMKKKIFLFLGLWLVLSINGCDNSKIPFGYVTGKLTIDDKPAPENMIIRFVPQNPGTSESKGFTNSSGNYEMEFSITRKGVEAGPNKVRIENPETGRAVVPAGVLRANNKELWTKTIEVKKGRQKFNFNIDTNLKAEEEPEQSRRGGNRTRSQRQESNVVSDADPENDD
jgi:hypothetical protein